MKRNFLFLIFFFIFPLALFGQTARIIDVKGDVTINPSENIVPQKAKAALTLQKDTRIQTGKDSECTLSFDEELKNILTIEENSIIKIESLKPLNVYIFKGKIFSLVEDASAAGAVRIKTPAADTEIKGAGIAVEFLKGCADIKCFENDVYVQSFGVNAKAAGQILLTQGYGIKICLDAGENSKVKLGEGDLLLWEDFLGNIDELRDNTFYSEESKEKQLSDKENL